MKTTFSTFLVVLATVLAIGCAKDDSGGGGGGGGNSFVNPPNPCVPDQFGNIASGCGGNNPPVGISGLWGSMNPHNNSEDESNSIVQMIQNVPMYPTFITPPGGFAGYVSNGFFVVTGGLRVNFRSQCGTGSWVWGDICTNECKNFRNALKLFLTTDGNQGTLYVMAVYRPPGGCEIRETGLQRTAQVPVEVRRTGGNVGFYAQSYNAYPFFGKSIRIDIPVGSPTAPGSYTGTLFLNGQPIGDVSLTRQ